MTGKRDGLAAVEDDLDMDDVSSSSESEVEVHSDSDERAELGGQGDSTTYC